MDTQTNIVMFFDKDGTLLPQSETFKHIGYQRGFRKLGFDLDPSVLEPYEGKDGTEAKVFLRKLLKDQLCRRVKNAEPLEDSLTAVLRSCNLEDNQGIESAVSLLLASVRQTRENFMMEMLSEKEISLLPEFLEFLSVNQKHVEAGRLVLALVTSDSRKLAQHFLDVYGLKDIFSCLVSIDDVVVGSAKPSPMPYKFAYTSTCSGAENSSYYFFEDSDSGVISACSAIEELGICCHSQLSILPSKSTQRPEELFPSVRSSRVSNLRTVLRSISRSLAQGLVLMDPAGSSSNWS